MAGQETEPLIPEEHSRRLTAPAGFDGPTKDRSCTDVFCLILIYALFAATTALGIYSYVKGDYRVVFDPLDYDGNHCGMHREGGIDMTEYKHLYYVNGYFQGVCVKECPKMNGTLADVYTLVAYGGVYQVTGKTNVSSDFIQVANYSSSPNVRVCDAAKCYPNGEPRQSYRSEGVNNGMGYAYYLYDSTPHFGRCIPNSQSLEFILNQTTSETGSDVVGMSIFEGFQWVQKFASDLATARAYILGFGFSSAFVLSFIYAYLLRFRGIVNIMVWGSIIAVLALVFGSASAGIVLSNQWAQAVPKVRTDKEITNARIVAGFVYFFGALLLCLTCYLRKSIILAAACTEATSKAVSRMIAMIFIPILEGITSICVLALFLSYMVSAVSMAYTGSTTSVNGDNVPITVRSGEHDSFAIGSFIFFLFGFFVTFQFIAALGSISISLAVAKWYFTRNKDEISNGTVFESLRIVMRSHQGTAAFGSFLIGLVQLIRAILNFIQSKAKQADNKFAEGVLCCCTCCFYCLENFLKFISKNAYIQTAIFGYGYCEAATEAFYLILRNAARVGAVEWVSQTLTLIGRLLVTAGVTAASYFLIHSQIVDQLFSIWNPLFIIAVISFFIADMFMDVYDMSVLTILQCFVADEEMFDGDQVYAEDALKRWLDKWDEVKSS